MNRLVVGSNNEPLLQSLPSHFLVIDDGDFIDRLTLPPRKAVTIFDVETHAFNPLKDMDYRRACEFLAVLDAVFPEGESTLTKRNANFQILEALLDKPRKLSGLIKDTKDTQYAYQTIERLLLSPVLKRVLEGRTNLISFNRSIVARLDRAVLGDFDAFVLGNLLISQFPGTVIIPDFGFYACATHTSLIRQNRLIAGITAFDEVPQKLRSQLLMIEDKTGSRCTPPDAETLALYAGIPKGTNGYNAFIARNIA